MRRLSSALAATALVATTVLAASSATAAPAPADSHRGEPTEVTPYVAMGDSYSATGIKPLDPGPGGQRVRAVGRDVLPPHRRPSSA